MPAQLAQALYDNAAESPEELSFRRGDVMLVLEKDAPALGGWWRCSLRGQQGIAPGNRLKLLPEISSQECEYQAPRFLGTATEAADPGSRSEEPQNKHNVSQAQISSEVYQVPPIARLCLSLPSVKTQEDIYNSPRLVGVSSQESTEVYDMPSIPIRDPLSTLEIYDSPALRVKDAAIAHTASEEIPEDIYDVPPALHGLSQEISEEDEDEGIYSLPSNLKRVSGLQNLYEAPEDILSTGHPPETVEPVNTHRLSVSSTGSARSADSGGSRESSIPTLLTWESHSNATCTVESLRLLHQELQRTISLVNEGTLEGTGRGCPEYVTGGRTVEALREFLGMSHVLLLRSCQASDPALHRELNGHLEQLEYALRDLMDGGTEMTKLIQEQSGCIVRLVSANAGILFPRPRLSSSESLSRRPLPALPATASPAPHRKGSIQDRPLPPPPTLVPPPSDPGENADSEYERIQCRDNHYVHLQGTVTAQTVQKPRDVQTDKEQSQSQEREVNPSEEDRQLLRFYAAQSHGHLQTLQSCVGTFLGSASSQPPRVFVGHGKQLVIAAHKLVFIGDTLGRLLGCTQLQTKLAGEGAALCQALKEVVLATKEAAAKYPSPAALKATASSVSALCTCARSFTDLLQSLAS
ncbi:embryonal Fyn-associated substrate [Spea bombifrons]|uniref:embryonal Fyn-associated substrate n=1 Tax=Spea bombifrons TaxID=233779 RepID=UPI0023495C14|nr:embryonal Fyn-associated substrate [Spea bombifrons]XP_053324018.1 embryonal Fyn-associated substrate [Spea bombifrons]XP_053324026.1 embryonal Fyn-associated substrate [Spea bombifrons]